MLRFPKILPLLNKNKGPKPMQFKGLLDTDIEVDMPNNKEHLDDIYNNMLENNRRIH